jgi:hypothetical protein
MNIIKIYSAGAKNLVILLIKAQLSRALHPTIVDGIYIIGSGNQKAEKAIIARTRLIP